MKPLFLQQHSLVVSSLSIPYPDLSPSSCHNVSYFARPRRHFRPLQKRTLWAPTDLIRADWEKTGFQVCGKKLSLNLLQAGLAHCLTVLTALSAVHPLVDSSAS